MCIYTYIYLCIYDTFPPCDLCDLLCVCVWVFKQIFTASTDLGLVKIRPPNLSGWKSWCFTNTLSSYLIKLQPYSTSETDFQKLTLSESSFRDTYLKDRTGIKAAVCPYEANSWNKSPILLSKSYCDDYYYVIILLLPWYKGLLHFHSLLALSAAALSFLQSSKTT